MRVGIKDIRERGDDNKNIEEEAAAGVVTILEDY